MAKSCVAPKCEGVVRALNLCEKHYRQMKKYGHVEDSKSIIAICLQCHSQFSYEAPVGRSTKKSYCSSECHSIYLNNAKPKCNISGCDKKAKNLKGGMCSMHNTRFRNHGDPSITLKIEKHEDGKKCEVDGCSRKVELKEYCSRHYQMWKKHGDPKGGRYEYVIRKAITHPDGTRTCSHCKQRLPISEFHKDKNATDGLRSKCKKCRVGMVREWYDENRERQAKKESARRKSNPEKYAEKEAKRYERDKDKRLLLAVEHSHLRKARKKNTKTERGITKLSLKKKFGTKCHYCGIEMDFSTGSGRKFNKSMATIEHLIPLARGGEHTWENTVLACRHCNISKNAKTIEEFEEFNKEK